MTSHSKGRSKSNVGKGEIALMVSMEHYYGLVKEGRGTYISRWLRMINGDVRWSVRKG